MTTYYNYLGVAMAVTATEDSHIDGTSAGNETIQAPAGNSSIAGDGGGDRLIGSSGDNTFWITDPHDVVIEQPGGGIDTENGWTFIALAPNVENLTVHGDFNNAVGNSLDNLIIVDGSQWVDGKAGNDVLVGSATQRTTFVETAGEGNDVIYNWNGNSQLQLNGYGFTTAAQIRAAMTQNGADVVLKLSPSETLTIRNATPAAFTDHQLLLPLDASKLGAMTFDDEFNSLNLVNPATGTGTWATNFGGNLKDQWAYTLPTNGEQQVYVAPGFQGVGDHDLGVNPFSVSNGVLTITAAQTAAGDVNAAFFRPYTSGMLNTIDTFQQKYGYFEVRAELPAAQGTWPAFLTLPHPYQPNVEGDVFEALGATPSVDYRRAFGGDGSTQTQYDNALKVDPTGFHTYGMLWTPTTVTFYLDGTEVLQGPTPSTWTGPMGLILNMAVGGFGGTPNPADFPADMKVDYVHVYALADGSSTVTTGAPEIPVDTIHDDGAASGQVNAPVAFANGSGLVTGAHIETFDAKPTALPAGQSFAIWEDSGAVFGAVSDGHTLGTPTALMAGAVSQFTGQGTWLTDGKVVLGYMQPNASGGQDAWDMVFDPVKLTFVRQDLGPATGNVHFVATQNGGFAVSWHAPDGTVEARGYDEYAYGGDVPGWYGPTSQITGDLTGVTADGHLIAANGSGQELYDLMRASIDSSGNTGSTGTGSTGTGSTGTGSTGSGQTLQGADGGGALVGGAGADTLIGGHGADIMTGGAGADIFRFTSVPWNPAHITDFTHGSDKVDVSALLTAVGYSGSDPIADGYLRPFDDGHGDTWIYIDSDGHGTADPWGSYVGQLDNVSASTVTLADFVWAGAGSAGSTGTGGTGSGSTGTGSTGTGSSGQTLQAADGGSNLSGGAGNDTLIAGHGADTLTGGAGADDFVFKSVPWNPGHITDFTVGTDKLDLTAILSSFHYTGSDPVADGYVRPFDDGHGDTWIYVDSDGHGAGDQWGSYVGQLDHVNAASFTSADLVGAGSTGSTGTGSTGTGSTGTGSTGSTAFVVFAGQSNMGGLNQDASTVTSAWQASPLIQIWNDQTHAWEEMQPGVNTGYATFGATWGPEVQFAIDFHAAHPTEVLRIVKIVAGGTQLAQDNTAGLADWSPNSSGELFGQATAEIQRATAANGNAAPTTLFWGQGEEDANYSATSAAYGANLSAFFTAARAQWLQNPNGDISFFQIGTSPAYSGAVRDAELSVDQQDPYALSFDTAAYPRQADNLHLTTAGLNQVGDNFFQDYNSWAPGGGTGTSGGSGSANSIIGPQAGGTIHGTAQADVFSFPNEPWSPVTITDFALGMDRIDLSALFQKAGYTGSDPVSDKYVVLMDDGAGGTNILYDRDGTGSGQQWPNYIIDLQHVSSAGLTWTQLAAAVQGSTGTGTGSTGTGGSTGAGSSSGQTLQAAEGGSNLTGGAGDDTLTAGHGADTLTGGAGADDFVFKAVPWNPGHVTDFTHGTDKLDLTAILAGFHYSGSDPLADGYVHAYDDGHGDTWIYVDSDGKGTADQWGSFVTTLDHLDAKTFTSADLVGAASGPASTPPATGGSAGQVITARQPGDTLVGGSGNDTLNASRGSDTITGGAGADHFVYGDVPWSPSHITDFTHGQDLLDLRGMFAKTGYTGTDPVADHYLSFISDGAGGTKVLFDADGAATGQQWASYVINLDHVDPASMTAADWIIH